MILPTKYIAPRQSLLGAAGLILRALDGAQTVTSLWEALRSMPEVGAFERFIIALDLLYAMGAVELDAGLLRRTTS